MYCVYMYNVYALCLRCQREREIVLHRLMRAKSLKQLSRVCIFFLFGTAHLIFHVLYMYGPSCALKGNTLIFIYMYNV